VVQRLSLGRKIYLAFNYTALLVLSVVCVLPFINVLMISLSSSEAVARGAVSLWPVDFTLASYRYVLNQPAFGRAFLITLQRVGVGTALYMFITVLTAYPLSQETEDFKGRNMYTWFFVFTMIFNGGLIPTYMVVRFTGIMDSLWALILPMAVNVFNIILMLNFFRSLPRDLREAAFMDGASHPTVLFRIYLPLSLPSLATITLFTIVFHWNEWFYGLIYMNRPENYPLQTFLQTVVINIDFSRVTERDLDLVALISNRTNRAAQIFVATFPILLAYPFLQRYFIKGIVLGSVKG
jgi:putative aldouronate transport system permease protein